MDNINQSADIFSLEGTVEKFEDKMAVIKIMGGQELRWPIKQLPEDIEVGSSLRLTLSTAKTMNEEREKIAKTILNQILKTNSQNEDQRASNKA